MMGGVEVDSDMVLVIDLEVADGGLGEKPGHNDGCLSKEMRQLSWRMICA